MPDNIQATTLQIPEALPAAVARVQAQFAIRHDVVLSMGIESVRDAVHAAMFDLRGAISQSVSRAYTKSGLRKRSHNLINWACQQFRINIRGSAGSIFLEVVWDERGYAAAYWKAQTFGVPLGYSAKRPNMHLKARRFIVIDERCKDKLTRIVNSAIGKRVKGMVRRESKIAAPPTPMEFPLAPGGMRPTAFRARKTLRRIGVPADVARRSVASGILRGGLIDVDILKQSNVKFTGSREGFAWLMKVAEVGMRNAKV